MARPPVRELVRASPGAPPRTPRVASPRRRALGRALIAAGALGSALALASGATPALGAEPPPDGALLVVDGLVDPPEALGDGAGAALVDLALLESLPPATVVTETPWSTGPQRFEGTRLSALLDAVGAAGYRVRALGIDDYAAELDPDEIERYPVIVAWRHDGAPMTVRTLGPLRIVYPFDDHPELANASGESRSVWQLVRLTVLD